jgi:hypothetical protein
VKKVLHEKRTCDATEAESNNECIKAMNIHSSAINLSQNNENKAAQTYLNEKKKCTYHIDQQDLLAMVLSCNDPGVEELVLNPIHHIQTEGRVRFFEGNL